MNNTILTTSTSSTLYNLGAVSGLVGIMVGTRRRGFTKRTLVNIAVYIIMYADWITINAMKIILWRHHLHSKYKHFISLPLTDSQYFDTEANYQHIEAIRVVTSKLHGLRDIIDITENYTDPFLTKLMNLRPHLVELFDNFVGIQQIEQQIFEIIIHFAQHGALKPHQRLHTVIYGAPGSGKTTFCDIYAKILCEIGILKTNKVTCVRPHELIGQYTGQTAPKTQKIIDDAMGGILLIDEAYSMGGDTIGHINSYGVECINTLNQNLTERGQEFICVLAGYEREMKNFVFALNPGLARRFSFTFRMPVLDNAMLYEILVNKLHGLGFNQTLDKDSVVELFTQYPLKNGGGTIEQLLLEIEILMSQKQIKSTGDIRATANTIDKVMIMANSSKSVSIDDLRKSITSLNKRTGLFD